MATDHIKQRSEITTCKKLYPHKKQQITLLCCNATLTGDE